MKGSVSRYCTCRDADGRQLGARCPDLATNGKHGQYQFLIDLPRVAGRRKEMRRRGFRTSRAAHEELERVRARFNAGVTVNDKESTGDFLLRAMAAKAKTLKPTTSHMYGEYVTKALVPALGAIRLEHLRHEHVQTMVDDLVRAGRGATTVRRIIATLSSLLADGVRQRRLSHNACEHVALPAVDKTERLVWTAAQAVTFMEHARSSGERLTELFEVVIGTGLRRGEALALRWPLVDVATRSLHIDPKRGTLSDVAGKLVFTAPKTTGSAAGVGLSARVVAALVRQAARQEVERAQWGDAYDDDQLVFCRENGAPLRPKHVLQRFHELSEEAGLPRVRVHDLRHLAVTLMLSEGIPLPVASKFVRHSQYAITVDLYGHQTAEMSTAAADAIGSALDAAAAELAAERAMTGATTVRPQVAVPSLLRGRG